MEWEFGVSRCKLLYIEWINNKILLYSTRNYIQYPVVNHNGKDYENKYTHTHTHIYESFYCTAEINTTLWINYTSILKSEERVIFQNKGTVLLLSEREVIFYKKKRKCS